MVKCEQCQYENAAGDRYCSSCGQQLPRDQGAAYPPPGAPPAYGPGYASGPYPPPYQQPYQPYYPAVPMKDPGIAVIIALVGGIFGFMGLGHLYVGAIGRGLIILVAGFLLWILGIFVVFAAVITIGAGSLIVGLLLVVAGVALFIWQVYDAYRLAKRYNEAVRATGAAPW